MSPERTAWLVLWGLVGLTVGSFLTVVTTRLPAGQSIVRPRSACPRCRQALTARDLVPVVSWLLLRGRCRRCGAPIPAVYPLLEALTGLAWMGAFLRFDLTWSLALAGTICSFLLAVVGVHLGQHRVPPALLLGGLVLTAPVALLAGLTPWPDALLGGLAAGGLLLVAGRLRRGWTRPGDVQLAAIVGLALGWRPALLMGAVVLGVALVAAAMPRRHGQGPLLAAGPAIAVGAVVALFWGQALL